MFDNIDNDIDDEIGKCGKRSTRPEKEVHSKRQFGIVEMKYILISMFGLVIFLRFEFTIK